MPIYEYKCKLCEHAFEEIQKVADKPLRKCPECGKSGLEKLVSAPSFQLKGSGWYETDFKDKKKPEPKSDKKSDKESSKESSKE